ncbi:hypothetical protein AUF78_13205 [archaeon 13_1_20CM_2_51_12]|nr:MAG: hypothetical protein AUF78_13205 [archaeon 13_1_20CM_2_51_12]
MKGMFRHGTTAIPLLLAIIVGSGLTVVPALIASSRPSNTPTSTNTTSPATTSKGTNPGFTGMVAGPASSTSHSNTSNQTNQSLLGTLTPLVIITVALILSVGVNRLAQRRVIKTRSVD